MVPESTSLAGLMEWVADRLSQPRNTSHAWSRFAPELSYGRHHVPPPHDARRAAVLVLLYTNEGNWQIPLMERPADTTIHSGQICFPGGEMEVDESPEQTAQRECEEEFGVSRERVGLCGRLTATYIYASNFLVTPCVAVTSQRPVFQPNPREVAHLIEPSLAALADRANHGRHEIRRRGLVFETPHIEYQGRRIWGATAMMLAELMEVLG
jgi:8-oxo-dGTP pyrophosphatase MutT (NUDIX family)